MSFYKDNVILWDMNGVLLDDEVVHEKCFQDILESFTGVNLTHQDYLDYFIGKTDALGMIDFFANVEQDVDPSIINMLCGEKNRLYVEYFAQGLAVNPHARALLENLEKEGYKQALVTCDQRPDVEKILDTILPNVFQSVVSAQDVKNSKPFSDPYVKAAQEMNVAISQSIVVEDTEAGVVSARNAGANVIGYSGATSEVYAKKLRKLGAARIADSLENLTPDFFEFFKDEQLRVS